MTDTQATGILTVKVPDVGEGVAEVEIVTWVVQVGDTVARLQTVAEVMTDKATVEVPSPVDGVVTELGGDVGDVLLVGSPLLRLSAGSNATSGSESAPDVSAPDVPAPDLPVPEVPDLTPKTSTIEKLVSAEPPPGVEMRPHTTGAPVADEPVELTDVEGDTNVASATAGALNRRSSDAMVGGRALATPAVRRRAREAGIDLRWIASAGMASGPAGRITHEDLDVYLADHRRSAAANARPSGPAPRTGVTEQPVVGLRRRISQQMVASASSIPHITYVEEVDVTALEDLRASLNQRGVDNLDQPRLTILPFLVRAITNALIEFPQCNAHLIDGGMAEQEGTRGAGGPDTLVVHEAVHVGIATQTDNGLIVPVLKHAEAQTIWSTATGISELSEATRAGTASAENLSGSTITITSLGPLGGIVTTPIINRPEVAIIGVNKIVTRPVWIDGEFVPRKMMNLSSSFDHRVIDGWDAANFVQAIKTQIEQPALLFVDDLGEQPIHD